jgi:NAD(P)-dependent dehydrogenase (short-subunit alcohol dehydrogenase family)
MNVFVTGGAGYIGSICTEELLNAGHQVTVYDNLTEGHRSAVDNRAKFILGKPEEPGDILNAVKSTKPDAIMHFAANTLDLIAEPLNFRWLERASRSHSAEPLREPVYSRAPLSPSTLEKLRRHPQFQL